jgi:hypothetical protein
MRSQRMQRAAMTARDAHLAMLDLKKIVDSATENVHVAERETTGLAIGLQVNDPLKTLRLVVETLRSPDFEAALSLARTKIEIAVSAYPATGEN